MNPQSSDITELPERDGSHYVRSLTEIVRQSERAVAEYPYFEQNYRKWKAQRKITVETIDDLRDKLDSVCVYANVARGAGNISEIVGGLASIASIVGSYNGSTDWASTWKSLGSFFRKAGDIAIPTATLIEHGFTKVYMQQVEDVLKKDVELSRPLSQFLQFSRSMDKHLQEIFGCGLESSILNDVIFIYNQCLSLVKIGEHDYAHMVQVFNCRKDRGRATVLEEVGDIITRFRNFFDQVQHLSAEILPKMAALIQQVKNIFNGQNEIIQFCKLGLRVQVAIYASRNVHALSAILMVTGNLTIDRSKLSPLQAYGLEASNLAANAASLIFAGKVIKEGKSIYSEMLRNLRFQLMLELASMGVQFPLRGSCRMITAD